MPKQNLIWIMCFRGCLPEKLKAYWSFELTDLIKLEELEQRREDTFLHKEYYWWPVKNLGEKNKKTKKTIVAILYCMQ